MNTIPQREATRLAAAKVWHLLTAEQKRQLVLERGTGTTPPAHSLSARPVAKAGEMSESALDLKLNSIIAESMKALAKLKSSRVTHGTALSPKLRGMDLYKAATRKQHAKLTAAATMPAHTPKQTPGNFPTFEAANNFYQPLLEAARARCDFHEASRLNAEWTAINRSIPIIK
jgi:hypothetical protein